MYLTRTICVLLVANAMLIGRAQGDHVQGPEVNILRPFMNDEGYLSFQHEGWGGEERTGWRKGSVLRS